MVDTLLLGGATVTTASMTQAIRADVVYVNRARKTSDSTHLYWISLNAPDPEMKRVVPAVGLADYDNIVWVKDRRI